MRLVEVVMLMGAHCVSPVEHSQMMTEATKVQCAVVIEKDTDRGTMTVTPQAAASDPQVAAAVARFSAAPVDAANGSASRIVPAWAPAGSPTTEIKLPEVKTATLPEPVAPPSEEPAQTEAVVAAGPPPATEATDAAPVKAAPTPEKKVAVLTPPPPKQTTKQATRKLAEKKKPAKVQAAAASKPRQCKGGATARWYTNAAGQTKFRCVKPNGDDAPDQLY